MRPRRWLGLLAVLVLLPGAQGRGEAAPEDPPSLPVASNPRPRPADLDLAEIRDIFRYADEPVDRPIVAPAPGGPGVSPSTLPGEVPPPPRERSRLIGLVQRSGRTVAAVSIDGEVLLIGEGESALGFKVLDIRDEVVRVRDPEGNERTLELP